MSDSYWNEEIETMSAKAVASTAAMAQGRADARERGPHRAVGGAALALAPTPDRAAGEVASAGPVASSDPLSRLQQNLADLDREGEEDFARSMRTILNTPLKEHFQGPPQNSPPPNDEPKCLFYSNARSGLHVIKPALAYGAHHRLAMREGRIGVEEEMAR